MGGHHHHHHHNEPIPVNGSDQRYRAIRRVTLIGSVLDLALAVAKMVVGFIAQSQALIADGVHSLSDLATDFMVLWAAKHGSKEADADHPYGHGRIETLATVLLGVALIAVAIGIAWDAIDRLFNPNELLQPGLWALVVAGISVLSKEWIYHYTMRVARKVKSKMLEANAWHSRSDAISSIVVVIGVGGTMMGLTYLDAIAAVGVALMVMKIGGELVWNSTHELIDTGLDEEQVAAIEKAIMEVDGVVELHMLRTRRMGGEALVDVHVLVEPMISVSEGHYIGEKVRAHLITVVDEVADVLVHIDPEDDSEMALSMNLPSRTVVVEKLRDKWHDTPLSERIERIQLHYIEGRIGLELYLPLDCAGSSELSGLVAAAKEVEEVSTVSLCYS